MFGNLLGWMISAVLVALALFVGSQILAVSQPTPPSGWVGQKVKPLGLDDTAKAVIPPTTNTSDDAGDLYRQAAADYAANKQVYEAMSSAHSLAESNYESLTGLRDILKAADCRSMDLFRTKPQEVVGYETDVMVLFNLQKAAEAAELVAALAKAENQFDIARKYAQAVWVLGYRLYQERAAFVELDTGESLLGAADHLLIELDEKQSMPDKLTAMKQFDDARLDQYKKVVEPVREIFANLGPQNLIVHAGDFFQLAADPTADRVWRVEAIRRVGRLYYNTENIPDQHKCRKFLTRLAADPSDDAVIKAAATQARDMSEKDYQCLR